VGVWQEGELRGIASLLLGVNYHPTEQRTQIQPSLTSFGRLHRTKAAPSIDTRALLQSDESDVKTQPPGKAQQVSKSKGKGRGPIWVALRDWAEKIPKTMGDVTLLTFSSGWRARVVVVVYVRSGPARPKRLP